MYIWLNKTFLYLDFINKKKLIVRNRPQAKLLKFKTRKSVMEMRASFYRVHTVMKSHEKSWNLKMDFPGLEKSWNLGKMTKVMEKS